MENVLTHNVIIVNPPLFLSFTCMLDKGYLRIPRLFFQSIEWKEKRVFSHFEAILSLYEQAAYTNERFVNIKGYEVSISRGQLVTTIRILAEQWNWSKSKVSRFLQNLQDTNRGSFRIEIEKIGGTIATLITICNYDGNEDAILINGTASGTASGTLYNKDIERKYKDINTHNLIELFTSSCARVHEERDKTELIYNELRSRGCFNLNGECFNIGKGMVLIGLMWGRFVTLQRRMIFPLTYHQANSICEKFNLEDIVRVLERMANSVDLEKKRKSVFHTLQQWLMADYDLKKKKEEANKHIYPGKL